MRPPSSPRVPGSTYVAGELVHGAILGHVVLLVRVILRKQPLPGRAPKEAPPHPSPSACSWRHLLADRCQDTLKAQRGTRCTCQKTRRGAGTSGLEPPEGEAMGADRSHPSGRPNLPRACPLPTARRPCGGRREITLMLSAKSSSALAPTVSMEVMRPGSLFLVLAAVP